MVRASECLALYYDPDTDPQTWAAIRVAFVRALAGVPVWAMHRAFDEWERTMTRRPTPAEIVILAQRKLAPLTDELAARRKAMREATSVSAPLEPRCSAEAAARIMAQAGFGPGAGRRGADAPAQGPWRHPLEGLAPDHPEALALRAARAASTITGGRP